jgi:hypothetical protein
MKLTTNSLCMSVITSNSAKGVACLLAVLLASCEKLVLKEVAPDNSKAIFEDAWKVLDERYPFFEVKNIDWNLIHTNYLPRVTEKMTNAQLFDVLGDMIMELHDGHTDLRATEQNWIRYYWPVSAEYYQRFRTCLKFFHEI